MKRIAACTAFLLVAACLPLAAQDSTHAQRSRNLPDSFATAGAGHGIRCLGTDGQTPCSEAQIETLNRELAAARHANPALAGVRALSLASHNGTLRCARINGAPCTAAELRSVRQFAEQAQKNASKCMCVMREVDAATP